MTTATMPGISTRLLRPLMESYAARTPVRTIAVVGNAPLEQSEERAAAIDAADLVIRCNAFVLDEPGERCVGTRTNVCVIAHVTFITQDVFRNYRDRLYLVPQIGHAFRLGGARAPMLLHTWPEDLGSIPIPNDGIGIEVMQEMKRGGDPRPAVPTSGTLATGVARIVFPEARLLIAGFSFLDDTKQKTWKHRYGTEVPVHPAHLLDREGPIMQRWVEESDGRILS